MHSVVITVLFDLTKSLETNEDEIAELLDNFDSQKVYLHLNEIGISVETKEECDKLLSEIIPILTEARFYPKIQFL